MKIVLVVAAITLALVGKCPKINKMRAIYNTSCWFLGYIQGAHLRTGDMRSLYVIKVFSTMTTTFRVTMLLQVTDGHVQLHKAFHTCPLLTNALASGTHRTCYTCMPH